jgi:TM2 domain-containing membrane protein YozV
MKRNIVAAVLSGILPGAGQFYNRQWLKGIAFLAPTLILSTFVRPEMLLSGPSLIALLTLVVILVLGIWSVVDAYRTDKPTS